MKRLIACLALCMPLLMADSCDNANNKEAQAVDHQQTLYVRNQPAPFFDFSLERDLMIQLYQLRNNSLATYSVVQSEYTGKVLWSCPSIGFPIPGGTQLTNPSAPSVAHNALAVLPQAEPNGLYTPATSEGTYVMCVDEKGHVTPVYEEKHVTAFVRPMKEVNGTLVPDGIPSAVLEVHKGRTIAEPPQPKPYVERGGEIHPSH